MILVNVLNVDTYLVGDNMDETEYWYKLVELGLTTKDRYYKADRLLIVRTSNLGNSLYGEIELIDKTYIQGIDVDTGEFTCSCPDHMYHKDMLCKHLVAVLQRTDSLIRDEILTKIQGHINYIRSKRK